MSVVLFVRVSDVAVQKTEHPHNSHHPQHHPTLPPNPLTSPPLPSNSGPPFPPHLRLQPLRALIWGSELLVIGYGAGMGEGVETVDTGVRVDGRVGERHCCASYGEDCESAC